MAQMLDVDIYTLVSVLLRYFLYIYIWKLCEDVYNTTGLEDICKLDTKKMSGKGKGVKELFGDCC